MGLTCIFVFPLVSCSEDLRRWFIQQEVDLFRYRFNDLTSKQKLDFLHKNNLQYNTVSVSLPDFERLFLDSVILNPGLNIPSCKLVLTVGQSGYQI